MGRIKQKWGLCLSLDGHNSVDVRLNEWFPIWENVLICSPAHGACLDECLSSGRRGDKKISWKRITKKPDPSNYITLDFLSLTVF